MPLCPVCAAAFAVDVPAADPPRGRDTDFRPHGDPGARRLWSCPRCHYAAYRRGFWCTADEEEPDEDVEEEPRAASLPEGDDLDDLRRYVRGAEYARGLSAPAGARERWEPSDAERFVLAARIYELLCDDDPLGAADYYLRGSWCARVQGDTALERMCQREAIAHYSAALDGGKVPADAKPRITYLLGELSRRAGDFARAVDCFREVDKLVDPDEADGAFLGNLARRQEALASVKSAVNAVIAPDDEAES